MLFRSRSSLANAVRADLFLSIHHDSGQPSHRGVQTYYDKRGNLNASLSRLLAVHLQEALAGLGKLADRGIGERPFHVLRNAQAPAVLVELGFITHDSDVRHLSDPDYQLLEARALVQGIEAFFEHVGSMPTTLETGD